MESLKKRFVMLFVLGALALLGSLLAAQAPPSCQDACLAAAEEAAKACGTLPPAERGACLAAVEEQLHECLQGCH